MVFECNQSFFSSWIRGILFSVSIPMHVPYLGIKRHNNVFLKRNVEVFINWKMDWFLNEHIWKKKWVFILSDLYKIETSPWYVSMIAS